MYYSENKMNKNQNEEGKGNDTELYRSIYKRRVNKEIIFWFSRKNKPLYSRGLSSNNDNNNNSLDFMRRFYSNFTYTYIIQIKMQW